jgi:GntR family transcriptional regulator/MocR family aminotransferase
MEFVIDLESNANVPLFRKISNALRKAILEGRLQAGQPAPSIRDLAKSLEISRTTVLKAYDDLQSQGYFEAISGMGTFVSKKSAEFINMAPEQERPLQRAKVQPCVQFTQLGRRLLTQSVVQPISSSATRDSIAIDLLPVSIWKRILTAQYHVDVLSDLEEDCDPLGYYPLRKSIAGYVSRARAIKCKPEQIVVFSEAEHAIDAICRLMLDANDTVVVEDPGDMAARSIMHAHGAEVLPIAVDESGISVSQLSGLEQKIKVAYVSPSNQKPSGGQMALGRRHQLLQWAQRTGALIVEDDSGSEFRFGTTPEPAIQALAQSDTVIYLKSFGTLLSPMVKMAFLIVPECMIAAMTAVKEQLQRQCSLLDQVVMTEFIEEGHLERYIRRTSSMYKSRRQAMIFSISRFVGPRAKVSRVANGTFVRLQIESSLADEFLLQLAQEAKLKMSSTSAFYSGEAKKGEFILHFAPLDEEAIESRVRRFAFSIDQHEKQEDQASRLLPLRPETQVAAIVHPFGIAAGT